MKNFKLNLVRFTLLVFFLLGMLASPLAVHAKTIAYITNIISNTISMIDTEAQPEPAVIAELIFPSISPNAFTFGIAASPDGNFIYATTWDDNVSAYVLKAMDVTQSAPSIVGSTVLGGSSSSPQGIVASPNGSYVYVASRGSSNFISMIKAGGGRGKVLDIRGAALSDPVGIAISPDSKTLYVTNYNSDSVIQIDVSQSPPRLVNSYSLVSGSHPMGITLSADGHFVYVANSDKKSITMLSKDLHFLKTIALGSDASPYAIAVNRSNRTLYVSSSTHSNKDSVFIVDRSSGGIIKNILMGGQTAPHGISLTPNEDYLYVANFRDDSVSIIELGPVPRKLPNDIPVGTGMTGPAAFGNFIVQTLPPQNPPPPVGGGGSGANPPSLPNCGNNTADSGETCDGTNLNGKTCADFNFVGGTLSCRSDCTGYDTSGCQRIGSGLSTGIGGSSSGCSLNENAASNTSSFFGYAFFLGLLGILLWRRKINEKF